MYRAIHTLWEDDDNFTLDPSRLEGWYQHNIWSLIIDPAFRNSRINLIRGAWHLMIERMMQVVMWQEKNGKSCDVDRKKIVGKGMGFLG